jgi:complement component 1 Q subcomponent-binding protein
MTIDAVAQDGVFLVDNISLYKDEKLATDLTSEADWSRRGLYMGPAVSTALCTRGSKGAKMRACLN